MRVWALASCGGVLALAACSSNTASTTTTSTPPLLPDDWDFSSAFSPAPATTAAATVEPQRQVSAPTLPSPIPEQARSQPAAPVAPEEPVASAQRLQTRLAELRARRGPVTLPALALPAPLLTDIGTPDIGTPDIAPPVPPAGVGPGERAPVNGASPQALAAASTPGVGPAIGPGVAPATDPAQGPVSYRAEELVVAATAAPRPVPHPGHQRHLASGEGDLAPTLTVLAPRYHGPSAPEPGAEGIPDPATDPIPDPTPGLAARHQGTAAEVVLSPSTQTLSGQTLSGQALSGQAPPALVAQDGGGDAGLAGDTALAVAIAGETASPPTLPLHGEDPSARLRAILAARAAADPAESSVPAAPIPPGPGASGGAPVSAASGQDVPVRADGVNPSDAPGEAMGPDASHADLGHPHPARQGASTAHPAGPSDIDAPAGDVCLAEVPKSPIPAISAISDPTTLSSPRPAAPAATQGPAFSKAKPCPGGINPLAQITPDAATAGTPIPGSVESPTR